MNDDAQNHNVQDEVNRRTALRLGAAAILGALAPGAEATLRVNSGTSQAYLRESGKTKDRVGYVNFISARAKPEGETIGCNQWIDKLVITKDSHKGTNIGSKVSARFTGLPDHPIPLICTHYSRDVIAMMVDKNGRLESCERVPYVLVGKFDDKDPAVPVEIWLSDKPFDHENDQAAVKKALSMCCV